MLYPSSEPPGSCCANCGNMELAHLRGEAKTPGGKPCSDYQPEGGVTKPEGLAMISAAAEDAERRSKR